MNRFITTYRLISIIAILFLLGVWKLISLWAGSGQIVPSPEHTFLSVIEIVTRTDFFPSVLSTIYRGLLGFLIAMALAFLLGVPAGMSRGIFIFLNPLLVAIRSTPVISLILLIIIWAGSELVPVFIAVLTMFPIICINIIEGIRHVDKSLIEMGHVYKVSRYRILAGISIPSILPFLTGGISNALGFGWRAIIIGEVLAQPYMGIGTRMQDAQIFLMVSELIAWTLVAILISYLFEALMRMVEKKIVIWK
jgi:NitT/TauT family transport system permease protein